MAQKTFSFEIKTREQHCFHILRKNVYFLVFAGFFFFTFFAQDLNQDDVLQAQLLRDFKLTNKDARLSKKSSFSSRKMFIENKCIFVRNLKMKYLPPQ